MNGDPVIKAVEQWGTEYLVSPPELTHGTTTNAAIVAARQAMLTGIADAIRACDLQTLHCGDDGPASFGRRLKGPIAQVEGLVESLSSTVTAAQMSAHYEPLVGAVQRLIEVDSIEIR